jgi:hypothetical protein
MRAPVSAAFRKPEQRIHLFGWDIDLSGRTADAHVRRRWFRRHEVAIGGARGEIDGVIAELFDIYGAHRFVKELEKPLVVNGRHRTS